jgi:DHA1 family bicyclomycin/chloramphenicol resistance-like MFS transporter
MTGTVTDPPPPRHFAYLLGFIIAVGPVSVDMYLPAFAQIAQHFGVAVPQLTLASYFAGFAVGQLAQGLLSDRFGRRGPLGGGLLLYTLASLGCAAAPDAAVFCVFRALAAFGAAASIVIPRAMVRDLADGTRAASLMSDVLLVMSVAPVLAPVLGSVILMFTSWRMIFVLAALYGVAGLFLLVRYLPETLEIGRRKRLGVASAMGLYLEVLGERSFLVHACIGAFGMAALFAYLAGAPGVLMGLDGLSTTAFGLVLAALGVAMIGFFRINGWLVRRMGAPFALQVGIGIWLLAGALLCGLAWTDQTGALEVFIALLVFSLGYSFIPSNSQVGALSHHAAHAATATSLMSTFQYGAGALAGALIGAYSDGTARPMATIILGCALGAAGAAKLRPRGSAGLLTGSAS